MKSFTYTFFLAVGAAAAAFAPWCYVIGYDNFDIIVRDGVAYKTFRYGFPFQIIEGYLATPVWQNPWKLAGNFIVFLVAGLAAVFFFRALSKPANPQRAADDPL